jgi:hypothetical protein
MTLLFSNNNAIITKPRRAIPQINSEHTINKNEKQIPIISYVNPMQTNMIGRLMSNINCSRCGK